MLDSAQHSTVHAALNEEVFTDYMCIDFTHLAC